MVKYSQIGQMMGQQFVTRSLFELIHNSEGLTRTQQQFNILYPCKQEEADKALFINTKQSSRGNQ